MKPPSNASNSNFAPPVSGGFAAGVAATEGGGVSFHLLENVHSVNGKTVAGCPACAADGHDKSREHLVIDAAGRFGCVKYPGAAGAEHRRRIFALVGEKPARPQAPRKTPQRAAKRVETWPDIDTAAKAIKPRGFDLTDVYPYERGGALVGWVARYDSADDKTFRQFHPEGGAVASGRPAEAWPLFMIDGIADGRVYVGEGEKAMQAALSIGLNATTSAGGSGAASKTDWTPLAGRDVVLLADNDKDGEKYAAAVAGILFGLGCTVRILRLPGLPAAGDLVEYIEANPETTAEDVQRMAAAVAPEVAAVDVLSPIGDKPETEFEGLLIDAADWLATEPAHPEPVLEGVFDLGDKVCLIAASKMRKSFMLLQGCICMAAGVEFLHWTVARKFRVLLVQVEIKSEHYHRRVRRMHEALRRPDIGDRLRILNARGCDALSLDAVARVAQQMQAEVIAFDPLYKLATGDENSAEDMKPVLAAFDRLAQGTGAAVLYVHHDPKGDASERNIRDRGAGSGVLARDYDACITLTAQRDNPDTAVIHTLLRNYPPRDPFCATWDEGCFHYDYEAAIITGKPGKYDEAIRTAYKDNPAGSLADIAAVVGCDRSTVSRVKERLGVA